MSRRSRMPAPPRPELAHLTLGVYVGAGASHSWTWLADSLEAHGFSRLLFLDEDDVAAGLLAEVDAFAVGGGDPVAMAVGMGAEGADRIRGFVEAGGLYLGFCAGAYLVMPMEHPPMEPFTFTGVRAANVVFELPPARALPHKMATAYDDRFTLHPVRERVTFEPAHPALGTDCRFDAPLYGGPPMVPSEDEEELARFHSFGPDTLYLVDEGLARSVLLGRAAVCRRRLGGGALYLFAPHVEHPAYPSANGILAGIIARGAGRRAGASSVAPGPAYSRVAVPSTAPRPARPWAQAPLVASRAAAADIFPSLAGAPTEGFRHALAEARLAALAVACHPVTWLLGHKYYDPEKIVVLLEAAWRRLGRDGGAYLFREADEPRALEEGMREALSLIRDLGRAVADGRDGGRADPREPGRAPAPCDDAGHAEAAGTGAGPAQAGAEIAAGAGAGRAEAARLFPLLNHVVARFLEAHFVGLAAGAGCRDKAGCGSGATNDSRAGHEPGTGAASGDGRPVGRVAAVGSARGSAA